MVNLSTRLTLLEQRLAAAVRMLPVPFRILPAAGDPRREAVQADIAERAKAGKRSLIYEIV